MKALIRARDFYHQEAAILWMQTGDPRIKRYLEQCLSKALCRMPAVPLAVFFLMGVFAKLPGMTWEGVYYPKGLFGKLVADEHMRRIVRRFQYDYMDMAGTAATANLLKDDWRN